VNSTDQYVGTVTSVGTSNGTFVNVSGGTITTTGTITGDLSATGTASSSTFLRGDNTWAVPSGGGGGMTSFDITDPLLEQFTVEDGDTVEFSSSDDSIEINCSSEFIVDLIVSGGISDKRLKENVKEMHGGLQVVKDLRPVEFEWNEKANDLMKKQGHDIGLIAQEVEWVLPEVVREGKNFKTIDYAKLTPVLISAIQELTAEVKDLRERLLDIEHSQQ